MYHCMLSGNAALDTNKFTLHFSTEHDTRHGATKGTITHNVAKFSYRHRIHRYLQKWWWTDCITCICMPNVLFVFNCCCRHCYQPTNTTALDWSPLQGSLCLLPSSSGAVLRQRCLDPCQFSAALLFNVLGGCGLSGLLACVLAFSMLLVTEYIYTFLMLTTNTT